jgi:signal transduction histidine kinase
MWATQSRDLWQIVTVPGLDARVNASYVGLAARVGAIMLGVLVIIVGSLLKDPTNKAGLSLRPVLLVSLLLLLIAALSSIPLPSPVPRWVQPLAETLGAAIAISAAITTGSVQLLSFLPYLLVPIVIAGLTAGAAAGAGCAVTAWVVILGSAASQQLLQETVRNGEPLLPLLLVAGLVAAWVRRVRNERQTEAEPAYEDAHRLLSELHVVARQLSLGLDPQTLAAALLDDVCTLVPGARTTVLSRSGGGRFVPLVGTEPAEAAASAMQDAWVGADTVRRVTAGVHVAALPVRMGDRVVALVVLTADQVLDDDTLASCRAIIDQAGPRMASAMLFDDVRRLATTDERMRVAREIHDGIAQDLASVGYLLDDIRSDVDDGVGSRVQQVRDQLRSMVTDLRLSIFDLRSGVDDTVSLAAALSEYVQRFGSQAGMSVHISMEDAGERLPIATEVEILRIVQEAMTNVRKHSGAKNLWLTLRVNPPQALVSLADDGRGLGKGRPDSMGITGMRERAGRIGAVLDIDTRSEGGTLVQITLPAGDARNGSVDITDHSNDERARSITVADDAQELGMREVTG